MSNLETIIINIFWGILLVPPFLIFLIWLPGKIIASETRSHRLGYTVMGLLIAFLLFCVIGAITRLFDPLYLIPIGFIWFWAIVFMAHWSCRDKTESKRMKERAFLRKEK